MQTQIKEYIRDEVTNQPRGIVVAVKVGDEVLYGYSLLNTKLDKFNKTVGLDIALNRANAKEGYNLPDTAERLDVVVECLKRIQDRALKYFKDLDPAKVELTFTFPAETSDLTEEA
jgi:hypothetical protein|tara:strand:+ start:1759 stop:2106 length:348 start_codon:yes stop_codon:yes gene_type:complete